MQRKEWSARYPRGTGDFAWRRAHLLVLLLALFLALDFADPAMPGALNFDVDLNKNVVLSSSPAKEDKTTLHVPSLPAWLAPVVEQLKLDRRPGPVALSRAVPGWAVKLRQSHSPDSESLPTNDDD